MTQPRGYDFLGIGTCHMLSATFASIQNLPRRVPALNMSRLHRRSQLKSRGGRMSKRGNAESNNRRHGSASRSRPISLRSASASLLNFGRNDSHEIKTKKPLGLEKNL